MTMPPKHAARGSSVPELNKRRSERIASKLNKRQALTEPAGSPVPVEEEEELEIPVNSTGDTEHQGETREKTTEPAKVKPDSASATCGIKNKWKRWRSEIGVNIETLPGVFERCKELKEGLKRSPKIVKDDGFKGQLVTLLSEDDKSGKQVQDFEEWRVRLTSEQLEDNDTIQCQKWLVGIVLMWKSLNRHKQNETEYRRAIDSLVELAFSLRDGARHVWMAEQYLALPGNPNKVKADTITTIKLPEMWDLFIKSLDNKYLFSWSYYAIELSVITLAIEEKRFNAKNRDKRIAFRQMIMDHHSSLKQRRALNCEGPVFGATLAQDELRFYVSYFNGDVHFVRTLAGPYKVASFVDFFRCYLVLCKLADYQADYLEEKFRQWIKTKLAHMEWLRKRFSPNDPDSKGPWRERPPKDNERSGNGDVNSQDPAPDESAAPDDSTCTGEDKSEEANEADAQLIAQEAQRRTSYPKDGYSLKKECLKAHNILCGLEDSEGVLRSSRILEWANEAEKYKDGFIDYSSNIWGYAHEEADPEEESEYVASIFVDEALESGKLLIIEGDMWDVEDPRVGTTANSPVISEKNKPTNSVSDTLVSALSTAGERTVAVDKNLDPIYAEVSKEVVQPGPTSADVAASSRPSYADVLKKASPVKSGALNVHTPRASSIKIKPSYAAVVRNAAHPIRNGAGKDAAVHGRALNVHVGNSHLLVAGGVRPLRH